MKQHSIFQEDNRKSIIYLVNKEEYLVVFYEDNECVIEKEYYREWEAEQAAEDFVLGFSV